MQLGIHNAVVARDRCCRMHRIIKSIKPEHIYEWPGKVELDIL